MNCEKNVTNKNMQNALNAKTTNDDNNNQKTHHKQKKIEWKNSM